jgi:predicted O-linked N-acetylglucosamine transferase (SPINDLY family)
MFLLSDCISDFFGTSAEQLNQFGQKVAHLHAQEPGSYLHPFVILSWPFIRPDTVFTAIQNAARLVSNKCMVGYPDDPDIWFHPELHNSIVDTRVSIDRSTNQFSLVGRRLRIGYLSPDLHSHHPVGVLLQSLFAFHDRSKFEIYCLSLKKVDSDPLQSVWRGESSSSNRTAMYFRQPDHHQCEHWMDVDSLDNQALFDLIREQLRLHIVIDLVGYCLNHRSDVLCGRPSPLQFNFLGFSSTMASNYTQYIIVDSVIAPLVDEASWSVEHSTTGSTVPHSLYSERLIRMPNSFMLSSHAHIPTFVESVLPIRGLHRSVFAEQSTCQQNCENAMKLSALRSALDMPTDALLLVCFAGVAKIPPMLPVWLRTLRMHNHTKLLLRWIPRKQRHSENASEIDVITARENIMQAAREAGVDSNRILFSDRLPTLAQHLQRLALADLAVDSFPYNQHSGTLLIHS